MFKVVCFPDFGCGGVICASLNFEKTDITDRGHMPSDSHDILKIGPSVAAFDREKWDVAVGFAQDMHYQWFGTHAHPHDIVDFDYIERIIYIHLASMESRCYVAARQCLSQPEHKSYCLDLCLRDRYRDGSPWTTILQHDKIIGIDLYHLVHTPSYRQMIFEVNDILYDEELWIKWYKFNDYKQDLDLALGLYAKINI
jgi:hypothetical protein